MSKPRKLRHYYAIQEPKDSISLPEIHSFTLEELRDEWTQASPNNRSPIRATDNRVKRAINQNLPHQLIEHTPTLSSTSNLQPTKKKIQYNIEETEAIKESESIFYGVEYFYFATPNSIYVPYEVQPRQQPGDASEVEIHSFPTKEARDEWVSPDFTELYPNPDPTHGGMFPDVPEGPYEPSPNPYRNRSKVSLDHPLYPFIQKVDPEHIIKH